MPNVKHIAVNGVTYDIPTGGVQIMTATVNGSSTTKIPTDFTVDTELDLNVGDMVLIQPNTSSHIYAIKGEPTYGGTSTYMYYFNDDYVQNVESYILPALFVVTKTSVSSGRNIKYLSLLSNDFSEPSSTYVKSDVTSLNDGTATMEDVLLVLLNRYKRGCINVSTSSNYYNGNLLPYNSSNSYVRSDESASFIHDSFIYTIHKYSTAPTEISYFKYSTTGSPIHLPMLAIGVGSNSFCKPLYSDSTNTDRYTVNGPSVLNNKHIIIVKSLLSEAFEVNRNR